MSKLLIKKEEDLEHTGSRLYVGGLNRITDSSTLKRYFEHYGEITDCVVKRDNENRSRGFGFVSFRGGKTVDEIISDKKDGHYFSLDNSDLAIERAHPRPSRHKEEDLRPSSRVRDEGRSSSRFREQETVGRQSISKQVFVSGMPKAGEREIKKYFERFGQVADVLLVKDHVTGFTTGSGFITFVKEFDAEACLKHQPHYIFGKVCSVKPNQTLRKKHEKENNDPFTHKDDLPPSTSKPQIPGIKDLQQLLQQALDKTPAPPKRRRRSSTDYPPKRSGSTDLSTLSNLAGLLQASGAVLEAMLKKPIDKKGFHDGYSAHGSSSSNYGPSRRVRRTHRPYSHERSRYTESKSDFKDNFSITISHSRRK